MTFQLSNDPTRGRRIASRPARQLKLLSGLDCAPGTQDLLPDMDKPVSADEEAELLAATGLRLQARKKTQ